MSNIHIVKKVEFPLLGNTAVILTWRYTVHLNIYPQRKV